MAQAEADALLACPLQRRRSFGCDPDRHENEVHDRENAVTSAAAGMRQCTSPARAERPNEGLSRRWPPAADAPSREVHAGADHQLIAVLEDIVDRLGTGALVLQCREGCSAFVRYRLLRHGEPLLQRRWVRCAVEGWTRGGAVG